MKTNKSTYNRIIKSLENEIEKLQETTKTHDGTSLGKIKENLEECTKDLGGETRGLNYDIIDDEGYGIEFDLESAIKEVERHGDDPEKIKGNWHRVVGPTTYYWADLDGKIINKEDIVSIPESGDSELGDMLIPNAKQIMDLLVKNEEGEYLMRGIHQVSNNYTRMSVLRNDKFNEENEKQLKDISSSFEKASKKYKQDYNKEYDRNYRDLMKEYSEDKFPITVNGQKIEYSKENVVKIVTDKARRQTIENIGSFEKSVLEGQNFYEKFESCNVKFKVSRKQTKTVNPFE